MLDSEFGCSLEETDIHLLFNGRMLDDLDANVQSCGIQSGSVLEMALSCSESIQTVLNYMNGSKKSTSVDNGMDSIHIFLCHLLFLELSGGKSSISFNRVLQYFAAYHYTMEELQEGLDKSIIGSSLNEVMFISLALSLLTSSSISQEHIKLALSQYPSYPVCEEEEEEEEIDKEQFLSFSELLKSYQQWTRLHVDSLWRIPLQSLWNGNMEKKRRL